MKDDSFWFAVSLRFSGEGFDPREVEAMLGLKPRHLRIKGESSGEASPPSPVNLWSYRVPASPETGFDAQIHLLFTSLKERMHHLIELARRPQVNAELFCGFGASGRGGGDTIHPDTLQAIASAGLRLTLDLYPAKPSADLCGESEAAMHQEDDTIPEVIEHPIGPELDLHTFRPNEIGSLIPEYLAECRQRGIFRVRIIHGKGTGTLRTSVHAILAKLPEVQQVIYPADEAGGSWGATWVILSPDDC